MLFHATLFLPERQTCGRIEFADERRAVEWEDRGLGRKDDAAGHGVASQAGAVSLAQAQVQVHKGFAVFERNIANANQDLDVFGHGVADITLLVLEVVAERGFLQRADDLHEAALDAHVGAKLIEGLEQVCVFWEPSEIVLVHFPTF